MTVYDAILELLNLPKVSNFIYKKYGLEDHYMILPKAFTAFHGKEEAWTTWEGRMQITTVKEVNFPKYSKLRIEVGFAVEGE